jgi:hypothetical protein
VDSHISVSFFWSTTVGVWSGASTSERKGSVSHLASLVLGDLVLGVLVALPALAVGPAGFGNVDLFARDIRELLSVRM